MGRITFDERREQRQNRQAAGERFTGHGKGLPDGIGRSYGPLRKVIIAIGVLCLAASAAVGAAHWLEFDLRHIRFSSFEP